MNMHCVYPTIQRTQNVSERKSVRRKHSLFAIPLLMLNLRTTAWIDLRTTSQTPDARACREKIQSFLQANYATRPDIDLNTYFILALNHEANISVIDPLSGFGSSKLYTLVALKSPGADWVMSNDQK